MTLKEILEERKRAAQNSPATAVMPSTGNQVAETIPAYAFYSEPASEFQALFADCADF